MTAEGGGGVIKRFFRVLSFFLLFSLFIHFEPVVFAKTMPYFTYSLDNTSASSGEFIKLQINANKVADPAAGFRMTIGYDSSVLSFIGTETSSQIKSGTMVTNSENNPIYSVYVCNTDHDEAPELSGNIISFVFKVDDDASCGKTYFDAHIYDVCNYEAENLNINVEENFTLNICQPKELSETASISELYPFQGELIPQFSPDVFKYSMNVDCYVNSVEFAAVADDGGSVKINRKSLQRAGTDTPIVATVTSENKKRKAYYVINVRRGKNLDTHTSQLTENENHTPNINKEIYNKADTKEIKGQKTDSPKKRVNSSIDVKDEPRREVIINENSQTGKQPVSLAPASKNIYIIGNQMPVYIVGMITAVLCLMVGMALCFYLKIKPKK